MPKHDTKHWRIQIIGVGFVRFESARLHMGSREAYTLTAENIALEAPADPSPLAPASLPVGARVTVWRVRPDGSGEIPFWTGTCSRFAARKLGGRAAGNTFSASGGWRHFERMVYTQPAGFYYGGENAVSTRQTSRVVLGMPPSGAGMISAAQQLRNILDFARQNAPAGSLFPNNFETGIGGLESVMLPLDELRDATLSQCLDRILRHIPGVTVAQRRATGQPALQIFQAGSSLAADAAVYMERARILSREDSADDSAVAGVRVEIERAGSANGKAVRRMFLRTAGATAGPNILHVTLQLDGRSASRTVQRLDLKTEDFPADLNDSGWWRARLGAIAKNAAALEIKNAARVPGGNAARYPRIALNAVPAEIEEAGLYARAEKITATASYTVNDEAGSLVKIVEEQPVEIDITATSGATREYSWTSAMSADAGEPEPEGLAAALLAQHANDGHSISALIRLPIAGDPPIAGAASEDEYMDHSISHEGLPGPGDEYQGLVCQTADYDLAAHTVAVRFGPPTQVSPQDLASMMVGARTRKSVSSVNGTRMTGEVGGDKIDLSLVAASGGKAAGEGRVVRSVIAPASGSGGAKIDLDSEPIKEADSDIKPREITFLTKASDGKLQQKKAWIIASEPASDGSPFNAGTPPAERWGRVATQGQPGESSHGIYQWKEDLVEPAAAPPQYQERANPDHRVVEFAPHAGQHT